MTPAPSLDPRPGEWSGITQRAGKRKRRRQVLTATGGVGSVAAVVLAAGLLLQSTPGPATIRQVPPAAAATGQTAPATPGVSATPASRGCTVAAQMPANALTQQIVDVDGDGRPDTGFIAGTGTGPTTIGVRTAAGGVFSTTFTSTNTTSNHRGVLFADVSGKGAGPFVALTDDNRYSNLFVVDGCSLVAPLDGEGKPYVFDLGYGGAGDGVACAQLDEAYSRSLVGFAYLRTTEEIRTAVEIDASKTPVTAANGGQDTTSTRDTTRVSCGDVTTAGLELGG